MKLKRFFIVAPLVIGSLFITQNAEANGVPITGVSYSDSIGLIHFDYKTAERPSPDPQLDNVSYYIGPTKQFYISPYDNFFDKQNPFSSGNPNITVQVSTDASDCIAGYCLLKGFAWSDTIGWIAFDGNIINAAVSRSVGLAPADEDTALDPYPSSMYPRMITTASAKGRFAMTGYAWNENTGWIRFSSDDSGLVGTTTDVNTQALGDWGVWLDGDSPIERITTDPGPPPVIEKLGRRFHGYAWSENLGWIKLSKESNDTFSLDFSAYTLWIPDDTPPIVLAVDQAWYAVGVNTGFPENTTLPTNIFWENFAIDPESGINEKRSKFHIKVNPNFLNCKTPPAFGNEKVASLAQLTVPIPGSYPVNGGGDLMHLVIPTIGNLKDTNQSYCKYELHAELVNQVNDSYYIGDHFLPTNPVAASKKGNAIQVYVRAGDFAEATSEVKLASSANVIADGREAIVYKINFNDIANNPIVPVDCQSEVLCSGRQTKLSANVKNELTYEGNQNSGSTNFTPVKYAENNVASSGLYLHRDFNIDPSYDPLNKDWNIEILSPANQSQYQLEIASYSPSTSYDIKNKTVIKKELSINEIRYELQNDGLPAVSRKLLQKNPIQYEAPFPNDYNPAEPLTNPLTGIRGCVEPSSDPQIACLNKNMSTDISINEYRIKDFSQFPTGKFSQKPVTAEFVPPIFVNNPKVEAGGVANSLAIGSPTEISFQINNISNQAITDANNGGISIDHIFQFYSPIKSNALLSLMEVHRIRNKSNNDPSDIDFGWTDPFQPHEMNSRYEMYMKDGDYYDASAQPNPLTSNSSPFKNAFAYQYDFGLPYTNAYSNFNSIDPNFTAKYSPPAIGSELTSEGQYFITGREDIPQNYDPIDNKLSLANPYNYPPGKIDRHDAVNLDLASGSAQTAGVNNKSIEFTAEKLINQPLKDIKLRLINEIAYRFPDQLLFTKYASKEPLFKDLNVQDLGLEATGTVSGQQNVIGRQFTTVGTAGTQLLQEQIRRNVARLTTGTNTKCAIPNSPLATLPISGSCVIEDPVNQTKVAYYEGTASETLILGAGSDLITPAEPYTIIVKGGANINLTENIIRNGAFGIILIADEIGKGSNVYLSPKPTNIQAVLYAEGSLISRSITGDLYYGNALGSVNDLANQLYWQGGIASKNTIGGSIQKITPEGVTCPNETPLNCAQRYDLDYLRRFTVSIDPTNNTSDIANNGLFSGGGSCSLGNCTTGSLPTTIQLNGNQIDENGSELAPVFVVKDEAVVNNPPPGFSSSSSLESQQEIR